MSLAPAHLIEDIRNFAQYRRTVRSLNGLTLEARLDLDIYKGDIPQIAYKAVYGS